LFDPELLTDDMQVIQIKTGLRKPNKSSNRRIAGRIRNEVPSVHGFRKFTEIQMTIADVDIEVQKTLSDHSIGIRWFVAGSMIGVCLMGMFAIETRTTRRDYQQMHETYVKLFSTIVPSTRR
jgi:hypothetical protein